MPSSPLNILLLAVGSHGDVHPMIGVGQALLQRGHRVRVIASAYFEELLLATGLDFTAIGTAEEFRDAIKDPNLTHPFRGFRAVMKHITTSAMPLAYEAIAEYHEPGRTVVAATSLGLGARIAHDKLGVPMASIHLQPCILRSLHQTAKLAGMFTPDWLPKIFKLAQYKLADWVVVDRTLDPPVNAYRAQLGLPPVYGVLRGWMHSPQRIIGLFPDWYAPLQPDWPHQTRLTGFPLYDEHDVAPMPPELDEFLAAGDAPLVFTPGSANLFAAQFLQVAVEACRLLGRRGILLTRFREQVPTGLPPDVRHFDFVPLSRLLPQAAALVHPGGIGTLSQALAAGKPQLLMPLAHDQPDNAARLRRLGVGDWLWPRAFQPRAVAHRLSALLASDEVTQQCRAAAARIAASRPLDETCELIEGLIECGVRNAECGVEDAPSTVSEPRP